MHKSRIGEHVRQENPQPVSVTNVKVDKPLFGTKIDAINILKPVLTIPIKWDPKYDKPSQVAFEEAEAEGMSVIRHTYREWPQNKKIKTVARNDFVNFYWVDTGKDRI